ncbi:MAG: MobC family plasmid mobilization relaxosome protein [Coleofasciculaceae cyanobacterium RL_1_1]|nr:MobC family plasmid mobilization relaxosome protein [Coleofasciculaceae cyanobacterium RL_1_1]
MGKRKKVDQQDEATSGDRSARITIRLTIEEREKLDQLCQGVAASTYIRSGLFGYPMPRPRVPVPAINRQTYIELNRIGVNLNQQTKVLNSLAPTGTTSVLESYRDTLTELKAMLAQIKVQLVTAGDTLADAHPDEDEDNGGDQP